MTPWLQDADVTLYHGDVQQVLGELDDGSVDCVVTSPPYLGLRDYGTPGQIGLEATIGEYVEALVSVFAEVRRVMCDHATLWLNLGDSYNAYNGGAGPSSALSQRQSAERPQLSTGFGLQQKELKPKDLMGVPWRVAFALQADGWWLRSDIIWAKPNPMPESVTDRPTKAHEYVFLLTKQPRYWFDQEAVREDFDARPQQRLTANVDMPLGPARVAAGVQQGNPQGGTHASRFAVQSETLAGDCGCHDAGCGRTFHADDCGCSCHAGPTRGPDGRYVTAVQGGNGSIQHRDGERWPNAGRNVRSVWTVATQPYPEAHFATYPEELVRRCVLAGCPERVCTVCGRPSERIVERSIDDSRPRARQNIIPPEVTKAGQGTNANGSETWGHYLRSETLGWSDCGHNTWRPGLVLDPFIGSGTTAKVARDHGRHSIGIDLSADYLALAARRLQQQSLFSEAR